MPDPYDYTNTTPAHDFPPFVPEDVPETQGYEATPTGITSKGE